MFDSDSQHPESRVVDGLGCSLWCPVDTLVVYAFPRLLKPPPPHMVTRLQQIPHMALDVLLSHFGPSSPNGLTTWCPCLVILCNLSCVRGPRYANIARRWSRHPWFLALVSATRYSYLHGVGRVDAITITCGDGFGWKCAGDRAPHRMNKGHCRSPRPTHMLLVVLLLSLGSVAAPFPGTALRRRTFVGALCFCGDLAPIVVGLPRSDICAHSVRVCR